MESFIDNPNPFCIQFIDGYIIQTTPADSKSCADPMCTRKTIFLVYKNQI